MSAEKIVADQIAILTAQHHNSLNAAADDRNASLLRSIHKISLLALDPRKVYCEAVYRAIKGGKLVI